MKNLSYSVATILVVAGSAFAAKSTDTTVLSAVPGFTGGSGERVGGTIVPVDVSGAVSWDGENAAGNETRMINLGAGKVINGIGWDVNLTAFGASWRNELMVRVSNSSGAGGFYLRPGTDSSPGGPTNYNSGGQVLKLANYNIPDVVLLGDGLLMLHFFESFNDYPGAIDGQWESGSTLFFQSIPTPAGAGLLGLAGVGLLGRKRR